ncbi:hypothetical protein [Halostella pelagica]|uniref:hypothetical protein n=1 Tax=Halostella pelagica TaxID=2583824 RepID=UPI0010821396|nr:hypothetical protein [Halostella pelagica]
MSRPSPFHSEQAPSDASDNRNGRQSVLDRLDSSLFTAPIRMISFWMAVALPFLHVPLLLRGLTDPSQTITFLGLLVVNMVALLIGHSYNTT